MKRYRHTIRPDEAQEHGITTRQILRLTDRGKQTVTGGVVIEEPLEIRIDGRPVAVLMRTPGMEKELATGFCVGEGLVGNAMEIALVRHCGRAVPDELAEGDALDRSRNQVDVRLVSERIRAPQQGDAVQLIRSGCGRTDVSTLAEGLTAIDTDVRVELDLLPGLLGQITRQQTAYRAAGGVHAAAVFDTLGRAVVVCEDIGRHNAVDKAVGYCLLRSIPLGDKLLVSTGRASYDMVVKAVRLGMPIVASISSPTSLAVDLAKVLNCTLLGYLRGKALNVYSHGWRLVGGHIMDSEENE